MTTGPADDTAAADGRGRGDLRASRDDREQVIERLKSAFVEERLTKEELDARVGQALASRTYTDLAALTVDIPGGRPREPARVPDRPVQERPPMGNARKAAICVAIAIAVPAILAVPTGGLALALFIPFYFMALLVAAAQILTTRYEKRSRGQVPPRPGQGGQAKVVPQAGQAGEDPALPGPRPDQTQADLHGHSERPHRDARAPRTMRPVPGVA